MLLIHFWDPLEYRIECAKCLNDAGSLMGAGGWKKVMVDLGELRFFPLRWGRTISGAVFCIQNDETKMPSEKKQIPNIAMLLLDGCYDQGTLHGTNISPQNGMLKMIFLFPRWDMLIPWRVVSWYLLIPKNAGV